MSDDLLGAAVDRSVDRGPRFRRRDGSNVETGPDVGGPEGAGDSLDVDLELGLGRRPGDRVENAVVGSNPVAAQMKGPVHREENVVVAGKEIFSFLNFLSLGLHG